jgi:L-ascorbate metabolism protein UlaG (beta-lactamase superfamily)
MNRRLTSTVIGAAVGSAVFGAAFWALREIPEAMGAKPNPELMRRSTRFQAEDRKFHNDQPRRVMEKGTLRKALLAMFFGPDERQPVGIVPLVKESQPVSEDGLHVTWYGHASTLVEIDGARVLVDPIWSERCSPSRLVGPHRVHEPPRPLEDLPALDAVVISHDHYDHLDLPSIRVLAQTQKAPFLVPLGVGAHLRKWGIPEARIVELDWNEHTEIAGIRFTATAAQHFSGRGFSRDTTLWASWVIAGSQHRVFYTGDSGYFPGYTHIGERYGPFDATLMQIGAYDEKWPDIHMTPEEGVAAHVDLGGELMIPVHWCTFSLSLHSWTDPADRVWREAKSNGVKLAVPKPGERIDVAQPPQVNGWWHELE